MALREQRPVVFRGDSAEPTPTKRSKMPGSTAQRQRQVDDSIPPLGNTPHTAQRNGKKRLQRR
jgi:hypothetical protein